MSTCQPLLLAYNTLQTYMRYLIVIIGALVLTTLGLDAADTVSGDRTTLLASLFYSVDERICGAGMNKVVSQASEFCIDSYELSTGTDCPIKDPVSLQGTANNLADPDCVPESKAGALPWRFVTYNQAEQLCARAGKMLPNNTRWYAAALGTPDNPDSCILSDSLQSTGVAQGCVSGGGAYDMIGNVWEFVVPDAAGLPVDGYVSGVNADGVPSQTDTTPHIAYGEDYLWRNSVPEVMLRGGFYAAKSDGGLYSIQAAVTADFSSAAIGFRCVRPL